MMFILNCSHEMTFPQDEENGDPGEDGKRTKKDKKKKKDKEKVSLSKICLRTKFVGWVNRLAPEQILHKTKQVLTNCNLHFLLGSKKKGQNIRQPRLFVDACAHLLLVVRRPSLSLH